MENKNKKLDKIGTIVCIITLVLLCLLIIVEFSLHLYCVINYGNVPADEIPAWVWRYLA